MNNQPNFKKYILLHFNMSGVRSNLFQINGILKNGKLSKNLRAISTTDFYDVSKREEDAEKWNDRICGF